MTTSRGMAPRPEAGWIPGPVSRNAKAAGFTLVEMMIVGVVLVIIAALGWPAIQKQMLKAKLTGTCEQISMHLLQARMEAVKQATPIVVMPDYDRSALVAFLDPNDNLVRDAGEAELYTLGVAEAAGQSGVYFMGPDGTEGTASNPAQSVDGLTPVGGSSSLRVAVFDPDGSIRDTGAFRVSDGKTPQANVLEVRAEPAATARVEVRKYIFGLARGDTSPDAQGGAFYPVGGMVWEWY